MRRRDFIALVGSTATAGSISAYAQRQLDRVKRVWVLMNLAERDPLSIPRVGAIESGLAQLGWTQGHNLRIDYRWAGGDGRLIRRYATELAPERPDVIIANGTQLLRPCS